MATPKSTPTYRVSCLSLHPMQQTLGIFLVYEPFNTDVIMQAAKAHEWV